MSKDPAASTLFWADKRNIDLLTKLWADGVSTKQIALRMNLSKNAIVGKAHRLGLEPRPSPIRKLAPGEERKKHVRPVRVIDLPKLESVLPIAVVADVSVADASKINDAACDVGPEVVIKTRREPVIVVHPCCYLLNSAKPWRYCNADSLSGKRMCAKHYRACYVSRKPPAAPAAPLSPSRDPNRGSPLTSRNW